MIETGFELIALTFYLKKIYKALLPAQQGWLTLMKIPDSLLAIIMTLCSPRSTTLLFERTTTNKSTSKI